MTARDVTIERRQHPHLSAWGRFALEAFPVDGAEQPSFQFTVLYLDAGKIVAYGGPFTSSDEAMANALKATWQYAETGENANLAASIEGVVDAFAELFPKLARMMGRSP